tara:strand:+ start:9859 stop:10134 length:276 start_codon:yes stop_codon:yes gene_type:complete
MTTVDDTLTTRGQKYGPFVTQAQIAIRLKDVIRDELNKRYKRLEADQMEALDMIANKIGRIINGDADYDDSWHDIAGYAQLVADRLRGDVK